MVTMGSSRGRRGSNLEGLGDDHRSTPTIKDSFAEWCYRDSMFYKLGHCLCINIPYRANGPYKVTIWVLGVRGPGVNAHHNPE